MSYVVLIENRKTKAANVQSRYGFAKNQIIETVTFVLFCSFLTRGVVRRRDKIGE
jgi:hypothetical protein